jgi:hypothetical protein
MNIVEVNTEKRSMRVHPVGIDMVDDPPLKHILKYGISKRPLQRAIGVKLLPARFAFVQPNGGMG